MLEEVYSFSSQQFQNVILSEQRERRISCRSMKRYDVFLLEKYDSLKEYIHFQLNLLLY